MRVLYLIFLILVLILTLVIILLYIVYLPPICLIHFFQRRWPDILWRVDFNTQYCVHGSDGEKEEADERKDSTTTKKEGSQRFIALTIDDTPSPTFTREILDVLLAHGAQATFFVIGSHVPKLPKEIPATATTTSGSSNRANGGRTRGPQRRWDTSSDAFRTLCLLVENGMELANHGMYDEPAFRVDMSLDGGQLKRQIEEVERLIDCVYDYVYANLAAASVAAAAVSDVEKMQQQQAETRTRRKRRKFYRPGSGFFTTQMREMIARDFPGMKIALGDVYPHDAQIRAWWMNAWHVLRGVRKRSTGKGGSIVIVHDGREGIGRMLTRVLEKLKDDPRTEWRVVSLGELFDRAG